MDLRYETGNADDLFGGTDEDTLSGLTGTSSTAGSVDVSVGCAGNVVVNNAVDALDI
jgi:hypothetical protein